MPSPTEVTEGQSCHELIKRMNCQWLQEPQRTWASSRLGMWGPGLGSMDVAMGQDSSPCWEEEVSLGSNLTELPGSGR
jgi:hypothetical protein